MDEYEASAWRISDPLVTNKGLVTKVKMGKARVVSRRAETGETLAEAGSSGCRPAVYEELSGIVDEVGRTLGGWLKHEARRDETPKVLT